MSTFWRIAFGCQLPDRSGWPSAVRGVGPAGGQSGVPPRPPRPCAPAAFEINSIAAAAATENVKLLAISLIHKLLEPEVYPSIRASRIFLCAPRRHGSPPSGQLGAGTARLRSVSFA